MTTSEQPEQMTPSGVTRVETKGSIWVIDNDLRRYCRFPKHEGPRERSEWGGPEAGALQDAVWHNFEGDWWVDPEFGWRPARLMIQTDRDGDGRWLCVVAPEARVIDGQEAQRG